MTPQDRSLLIGGAAFILAIVGLYIGMAVIGTGDQADTTTDASADAAAEIEGSDRDIELDSQADADVVSRLAEDGPNGGIDPAGPSSANSSTSSTSTTAQPRSASEPTAAPTSSAQSTTTEAVAPTTNPPSSVTPSSDPSDVPPNPEPSAPTTTTLTTTSSTTSTTTTVPSSAVPSSEAPPPTEATTVPPTTAVASTQPSTTEPPSTNPPAGGLDAVEQEILKLTNELRADPAGRLAREKPMPSCVTDPFYGIAMDAATGHPSATPALVLDEAVSLGMSRPWAVEMNGRNDLQHRPNGSQLEIYRSLDITVSATGENIAWFSGYPDEEAARVHFEGWRESDTGHYCAMVSGTYANIGVGHFKGATRSWAVQNFYSTR